jgi:DNA-binding MarR family transcriptional regulator
VWQRLRATVLDNDRRREVCDALGMSFVRVKALHRIAGGPCRLSELAEHLIIDRPYATLVVDDLVRRGLVERTPHPTDRRCRIAAVTEAGAAAAERAERILGTPPAAMRELPPEDLAALDRITARLADLTDARGP